MAVTSLSQANGTTPTGAGRARRARLLVDSIPELDAVLGDLARRVARELAEALKPELARVVGTRPGAGSGEPTDWPRFMTLKEAAAYVGCKYETMRYYVFRVRLLPSHRHGAGRGGPRVLKREDLDAYMARGRQPSFAEILAGRSTGPRIGPVARHGRRS
jgi:hypothetical protein